MTILYFIYLFVFGLIFGSFFNLVGIRTAHGESIVKPGSHCPKCNHALKPSELIPIFSYLFQKGRCKNCGTSISAKYPAFELFTAALFTISPVMVGWSKELLIAVLLVSLIIIITISDLEAMIIPNSVLLFFGSVMLVIRLFVSPTEPWWDAYAGAALGFFLLLLIALVSRGGMGGGDIKLFAVLGLFVGTVGVILTLVMASFIGLIYGLIDMVRKNANRKHAIPFGPFIGIAVLIVYYYYDPLLSWLNNFFMIGS